MARSRTRYVCQACGHVVPVWSGRCPECREWNSLVEARESEGSGAAHPAAAAEAVQPTRLADVELGGLERLRSGLAELDRVLGGGFVPGSLVLLGGAPGIGKSTLTGMALGSLEAAGNRTLYVTAEESAAQVRVRAERLGGDALSVAVLAETSLERVVATLEAERPAVCVVDSVQTLHCAGLSGAPGSVGQVREAAGQIMEVAKREGTAVVLVGHVTKDGALAGPRVLEHMVDCVLHFEGERERSYRTLRAVKNRFGSTNEVGVFEMCDAGLTPVADPSARFVGEATTAPGSIVLCALEGSRPVLVEVQALVAPTGVTPPRRVSNGLDRNRASLVLAVLARHGGLDLSSHDVFVSVAGGVRVEEPGVDLAIALAVVSAQRGRPLLDAAGRPLACFGEVGLTGELRTVAHPELRVAEATKFGLRPVLGPEAGEPLEGLLACSDVAAAFRAASEASKHLREVA